MITVGIDMSKNSPGVCVRRGDDITFISFLRGREKESKKAKSHKETLYAAGVRIVPNHRSNDAKEYTEQEAWKIMDASLLADAIVGSLPDDVDAVGIEGFSYGSKGNSALDIAGYAYCVRKKLFERYGSSKFCVFSPGNVKKTAGKGNAGKEEIMEFFMNTQDPVLKSNLFWKGLKDGNIANEKPVDDLVDSYYVQECTRMHFKTKMIITT